MLDLNNLTKEQLIKYNLEIDDNCSGFEDNEFFIRIEHSDWWVVGIDETKDIIYVQNDGDGIFHNISYTDIEDLEMNNYALIGVQRTFIDGMISTADKEDPIGDVIDWIDAKRVYKIKYGGIQ